MTRRCEPAGSLLLVAALCLAATAEPPSIDVWRAHVDGERALATVARVAPGWRWPGNRAFNDAVRLVADEMRAAGFVLEADATDADVLTYRVESRPMSRPSWEPISGSLRIAGDDEPWLEFSSNRNMILIGSVSTGGPVTAEIVDLGAGRRADFDGVEVRGRIIMADMAAWRLGREARARGAAGFLSCSIPGYNQPDVHLDSIPFSSLPRGGGAWGLNLSRRVRDRLRATIAEGPVTATVEIETRIEPSEELTLVAEVRGTTAPDQRVVLSAHVQEPGANDNASGVGCLAEIGRAVAHVVTEGTWRPQRTITMLWGDEIRATARYLDEDPARTEDVRYGISLDMVGEDTRKTGGTFLIEKMPDPSAVWTRGEDEHTEWGGRPLRESDLTPHWLNDIVRLRCLDEARDTGWVVRTNPYEGGSDHVPFLNAGKPAILLWHFTDVFYHTDGDTIDNVSAGTLRHVAVSTLLTVAIMSDPDPVVVESVLAELVASASARIDVETELSRAAIDAGADPDDERRIVQAWIDWYLDAIRTVADLSLDEIDERMRFAVDQATQIFSADAADRLSLLGP